MTKSLILLALITSSFINRRPDEIKIEIQVENPAEKDSFFMNDTIPIEVEINSDGPLHDIQIDLIDDVLSFHHFHKATHTHSNKYILNMRHVNTVKYKSNAYLLIQIKTDDGVLVASKKIELKLLGKRL